MTAEGLARRVQDPALKEKYVEAFKRSSFAAMMNYYRANYPREVGPGAKRPFVPENPAPINVPLLVIHNISVPPDEFGGNGVIELFTNRLNPEAHPYYQTLRDLRVSAHFFIRRDGEIIQFVPCDKRAWHAGASC